METKQANSAAIDEMDALLDTLGMVQHHLDRRNMAEAKQALRIAMFGLAALSNDCNTNSDREPAILC